MISRRRHPVEGTGFNATPAECGSTPAVSANAEVAQLLERCDSIAEVVGSSPTLGIMPCWCNVNTSDLIPRKLGVRFLDGAPRIRSSVR